MLRTSRLLHGGRTKERGARERAGVGGTGPPRGGPCPCGNSPGQGRDRWGSGKRAVDLPRATRWGAVGRCAQEVGRRGTGHRGRHDAALGRVQKSREGSTGRESADLDAKNRGVRRSRSRGREVPCLCQVPGGSGAGRLVSALRTQPRQTGHSHSGPLGGLPDRTGLTCVRLSVAVVAALRLPRRLHPRGTRNVHGSDSWLEMPARRHDALGGGEVTHRRVRADGMRIQQAEEEQAQPKHTRQSR